MGDATTPGNSRVNSEASARAASVAAGFSSRRNNFVSSATVPDYLL
jgi:hypothetical protein